MPDGGEKQRFEVIERLFRAALHLPREQRALFLSQQCEGETSVHRQVIAMLDADDQTADGVLDQPALGVDVNLAALSRAASAAAPLVAPLPDFIGRYRIVRVIGEGGMGVVYEAQQDNPRRRVALKVVRQGAAMGSRQRLQRFQQEAQILGRLQHPAIAQILEAGVADDGHGEAQSFIVMEYVHGMSLHEFAREHHLDARERLELMAVICDAVHFAHQNGVVHRDLKPGNILVIDDSSQGPGMAIPGLSRGQPKILDFGVARLTDADLQTATLQTTVGELIGTVPYMSPEQAAGDPANLDWRSDVYSLGVILYELLTDRLPQNVRHLMVHEAVRVIREEDPTPAGSIDRSLRGDVETILAKALEKEKSRRYQSAAEVAADIRRHLSEQPIAAQPASTWCRMRKFARRNKAVVSGVAIAFAAMAIATAFSLRQAIIAEHARFDEQRMRGVADLRTAEAERHAYRASMVAASSAIRYHEISESKRHLDAAPEQLRGWEWDHLQSRLDDSVLALKASFTPRCFGLSLQGDAIVSSNSGGVVVMWSVPEFKEIARGRLQGSVGQRRATNIAFSSDERELRLDAQSGTVLLHGKTLELISRKDTSEIAYSPDRKYGVTLERVEAGLVLHVTEMEGMREVFNITAGDIDIGNVLFAFSTDGKRLAACLRNETGLMMYRTIDGANVWRRPEIDQVMDISFSRNDAQIAVAMMDGTALVKDAATGSDQLALNGHTGAVSHVQFSPDGTLLATASADRTVRVWRACDGELLSVMHGNQSDVVQLTFMPDGDQFVTACSDGYFRWWDAQATRDPFVLPTSGTVYGVAFTPDGKQVVAACLLGERPLRIWDAANGTELVAAGEGNFSALAISPDGSRLALGRSGTQPTIITDNLGKEITTASGHWWRTDWLAFRNSANELLSLGNGGRLVLHDVAAGSAKRVGSVGEVSTGQGCRAVLSPDDSFLAVGSGQTIHLIDCTTWDAMAQLKSHTGNIYALAFSPDGKNLVSGAADRTLCVWDIESRQLLRTLTGPTGDVYAVIFSPDGRRVVSAGRDRAIRIWDTVHWEEITQLHGHTSLVYCLAFNPDGSTLASGGGDACVRLWDIRPYRAQANLRPNPSMGGPLSP
jgi:WD40 repeat protein/serine/threonine protein kinase